MKEEKSSPSSDHNTPPLPPVILSLDTPTISKPSSASEISRSESNKQEQKLVPESVPSIDTGNMKLAASMSSEAASKHQLLPLAHPFSPFPPLTLHPSQAPLLVTPIATLSGASPSLDTRATTDNGKFEALVESEADGERTEREHKKRSKNWTRQETLKLIKLRTELEPRFAKSGRKTELWDEIAESMQKERICRDSQQCRDKWEKLSARYKEVRDGLKEKEDNPFFDDLHPLLAEKSVKKEKERERFTWGKDKEEDLGREECAEAQGVIVKEVEREGEEGTGDRWEEEEDDDDGADAVEITAPARKKRKAAKCIAVPDVEVVQSLLDSVMSTQQKLFRDLLDAMERREQLREQLSLEREEKWRAEERTQRCVFNNAMIMLTQQLVGERMSTVPLTVPSSSPERNQAPKKRSKNWKRTEVLQLIKVRGSMESRFASSSRRTGLWEEVAELLRAEGIKRDAKQCREKWDKLIAAYKDIADGKREGGESPYFTELTAIFGSRPTETGEH